MRLQKQSIGSRRPDLACVFASRHRGIALVDVMIGTVLLAIGLAVVISLTSRSLATQTDGEKRLTAAWLADELLNMVLVEGPIDYPKLYDCSSHFDGPFSEFEYDVNIEDLGPREPFRVTATVRWPSGRGYQQIQVGSMIADRGGDPTQEHRAPLNPIDREERYLDAEQQNQ
jgi:hypothetical protein